MTELENTKDLVVLSSAIDRVNTPSVVTHSSRLSYEVLTRPSDLGRRRVVTNPRMMQFFEDAISTLKVPDLIYFDILGDLKAQTRCDVLTVPNNETGKEMISFLIERDSGKTVARTYMSWAAKVIQDGH